MIIISRLIFLEYLIIILYSDIIYKKIPVFIKCLSFSYPQHEFLVLLVS